MTVVNRKTELVKTGSAGDNFHTLSDGEESESETGLECLDEQHLWYATDDEAETCGTRPEQFHFEVWCFLHKGREPVIVPQTLRFCLLVEAFMPNVPLSDTSHTRGSTHITISAIAITFLTPKEFNETL